MIMGHYTFKKIFIFTVYFMFFGQKFVILAQDAPQILELTGKGATGSNATITCKTVPENGTVSWKFDEDDLEEDDRYRHTNQTEFMKVDPDGNKIKSLRSNLTILNATSEDHGNYTCVVKWGNVTAEKSMLLDLRFPGRLVNMTEGPLKRNATEAVVLECIFEVFEPTDVVWRKQKASEDVPLVPKRQERIGTNQVKSTYEVTKTKTDRNGTYICETWDSVNGANVTGKIDILILDSPQVVIGTVIPVGANKLYLNWTVIKNNLPIKRYNLMYKKKKDESFKLYITQPIGVDNTSFVIDGLNSSTEYELQLEVQNSYGNGRHRFHAIKTLERDPNFIPNITINGFSATSVTIGWAPPSSEIAEYIHYYELEARKQNDSANKSAYHPRDSRNLPYMFDDLEPYTTYTFRVRACSEYTQICGNWSEPNIAMTLDGIPGKPSNVTIHCYDADVRTRHLNLTWGAPLKPNAEIKGYAMELTGSATYVDQFGIEKLDTWGPLAKFAPNTSRSVRYDELRPNTNYTVKLSAMTRTRRRGEEETRHCYTSPSPPDHPPRPKWRKIMENDKYFFKMLIPRITQRNGPICCYRIYMVRMKPSQELKDLPSPKDINIVSYAQAHGNKMSGAYITDIFSNKNFPEGSELVMGDEISLNDSEVCPRCLVVPKRAVPIAPPPTTSTTTQSTTTQEDEYDMPTAVPEVSDSEDTKKEKRSVNYHRNHYYYPLPDQKAVKESGGFYDTMGMMKDTPSHHEPESNINVEDGHLDSASNYTLFVELIPGNDSEESMYSTYQGVLMPAPSPPIARPVNVLEIVLRVTCGVLSVVLIALVLVCALHTRRARKLSHNNVEMNSLQATLRSIYQGLKGGRHQLVTSAPPDMPPIAKEDLPAAYAERQVDSDYGFQREFEMLPDCFADRTTHASEARENQSKNRYPDIKAYDQTRVKLSQIDSIVGSDYINANYVMGYKERKKFICAQGPTDATVNDFWRMIWEHGLELIVMLTNLEEYSKVKCSKYWPDEGRGSRAFGNITVHHVTEKRYSDYIVRELKITKQPTNSEGQPIVDNNGISKGNGDCKESPPGSPRPEPAERRVRQYHFLMWKDFAAPEHPHSILKFIKRVNEAWAGLLGRPVVVHCSAGVGRTGTLVALDCLLQQLRAEGHAAVFNTVAELRRQRNFLVQSLKQYVFVYRALVEYAHYGDTEIQASKLKTSIDRLRNTPEGADKCLMEEEFERMVSLPLPEWECAKSSAAGAAEELRARNRSPDCLPYDRNRVILTPIPTREFSTYINASFIEAYDNSEGYIITQDPLPGTISDFWRMISEHNVATVVMLSELGDGERKCPRYWDDGTAQYDHISVQYEQNESCPYYTRREFRITNNKSGEVWCTQQLQYHGWPTVSGQVPEVTRGLAELADAAATRPLPMLVHCQLGTERSSMFVALCVLIAQLRTERRADAACAARKVRAQRARTLDTFLQYEFLHRAILNYAELHNLLEDS